MEFGDFSCPPAVIERLEKADLASSENSELFSWIAQESPLECQLHSVIAIADRLSALSHEAVIGDFCASVATYARFFSPADVVKIREAYLRFPYSEPIHANYFLGLRLNGIDIRDHLAARIIEDWTFEQPRQGAETWHYYLYLASLGEPDAIEKLARKIASTESGNDATNLLQSFSELQADGVIDVLERYRGDTRRADGTEGPGMMISENVGVWLMMRAAQQ